MNYTIYPFEGINEIKFNMNQKDIKKLIGKADNIICDNIMGEIREERKGVVLVYIKSKLIDIHFENRFFHEKENNLFLEEINFNYSLDVLRDLRNLKNSNPSKEKNGYINFYGLGICLAGFGKRKIPEGKIVYVYPRTRIESYKRFLEL